MGAKKVLIGVGAVVATAAVMTWIFQRQAQDKLTTENDSLRQQIAQVKTDNAALSNRVASSPAAVPLPDQQARELLRLRGEVGLLRRQTNELGNLVANTRTTEQRAAQAAAEQTPSGPLPEDYPKTADGATKSIFEAWGRGDWESFFNNFQQPGVSREVYDQIFTEQMKTNLAGMEVLSLGQPTNSFANKWFVPYKVRFRDGSEKEFRLVVAQDPKTQRWYFDGGF